MDYTGHIFGQSGILFINQGVSVVRPLGCLLPACEAELFVQPVVGLED